MICEQCDKKLDENGAYEGFAVYDPTIRHILGMEGTHVLYFCPFNEKKDNQCLDKWKKDHEPLLATSQR